MIAIVWWACASPVAVVPSPMPDPPVPVEDPPPPTPVPAAPEDPCEAAVSPPRECHADADCVVVLHQSDCCRTHRAFGIAVTAAAAHERVEAECVASYPGCRCRAGETRDDADRPGTSFDARCTAGRCESVAR